jgi:hypothetical protein
MIPEREQPKEGGTAEALMVIGEQNGVALPALFAPDANP